MRGMRDPGAEETPSLPLSLPPSLPLPSSPSGALVRDTKGRGNICRSHTLIPRSWKKKKMVHTLYVYTDVVDYTDVVYVHRQYVHVEERRERTRAPFWKAAARRLFAYVSLNYKTRQNKNKPAGRGQRPCPHGCSVRHACVRLSVSRRHAMKETEEMKEREREREEEVLWRWRYCRRGGNMSPPAALRPSSSAARTKKQDSCGETMERRENTRYNGENTCENTD